MYTLQKGRLGEKPKIKERDVNGQKIKVVNTTIYFYDPNAEKDENGMQHGTPCPIVAWEQNAEILASKEKGDTIVFIGPSRTLQRRISVYRSTKKEEHKDIYFTVPTLGYIVTKFITDDEMANDLDKMLKEISKGNLNCIPKV